MRKHLPDIAIIFLLFLLPLIVFLPQTLGGRTLLPADNLYQWEPFAAYREVVGAPDVPHNALVSDLVFDSKIAAAGKAAAVDVRTVRRFLDACDDLDDMGALLLDLNAPGLDAVELIRLVKDRRPGVPVVAFLSHVQKDLAAQAHAAGADEVLAKSDFTRDLPEILRRIAGNPRP